MACKLTVAVGAGAAGNASIPAMLAGLIPPSHQWRNADAFATMYTMQKVGITFHLPVAEPASEVLACDLGRPLTA